MALVVRDIVGDMFRVLRLKFRDRVLAAARGVLSCWSFLTVYRSNRDLCVPLRILMGVDCRQRRSARGEENGFHRARIKTGEKNENAVPIMHSN